MTDEHAAQSKKTERLHMLISPGELEAIDTWRFNNRVGTRADAVRRLTQIALRVDAPVDGIYQHLREAYVELLSRTDAIKSDPLDRDLTLKAALLALGDVTKALTPLMVEVTSLTEQVHRLRADGKVIDKTKEADEILKEAEERAKMVRVMLHAVDRDRLDEDDK
ncbi:hypothetical protein HLI03_28320 [Rhizobium laguerreae]|uniref:hypothetical protein n=1 Tax=Rhizobium laguerreae TaxID=1076926 RepID=UPI00147882BD|nr:hypothetical protein [Rhizobium laguerreae]NNH45508.1 hypothetical protein [Rhizobium laguerreae]